MPLINLVLRGWRYHIACGRLWVFPPAAWAGVCLAPILIR